MVPTDFIFQKFRSPNFDCVPPVFESYNLPPSSSLLPNQNMRTNISSREVSISIFHKHTFKSNFIKYLKTLNIFGIMDPIKNISTYFIDVCPVVLW